MTICKLCNKKFKNYEYSNRTRCGSCNTKIRRFRAKSATVKYLGEKRVRCGWNGNRAAFQFHHTDPRKKDFIIGNVANKSWDSIKFASRPIPAASRSLEDSAGLFRGRHQGNFVIRERP